MIQATIFDEIRARDAGIERVSANNEAINSGWQSMAFAYLQKYSAEHREFFPYELVAEFEREGYMMPHDLRSFGAIFIKGAKRGIIRRGTSLGKHPRRHASLVLSWLSMVCK